MQRESQNMVQPQTQRPPQNFPGTSTRYWTVPQIGELLAMNSDKVLGWLASGELVGVNIAARRGKKPRWRIADVELQRFLRARQSAPAPPAQAKRRRQAAGEAVFFCHGKAV